MSASAAPFRVALAEDHLLFRVGLESFLKSAGVIVTASCGSADELMSHIRADVPDIVILDIEMPPGYSDEGIRAAEEIRGEFPDVGILILSIHDEPVYASAAMAIGTTSIGYLLKDRFASTSTLFDAFERILNRERVVDPSIVEFLIDRPKLIDALTNRQLEVLKLMAEGYSNFRIAKELSLELCTVEKYIAEIFQKLGLSKDDRDAHRRVQAVLAFLRGS
ncbi:response regulator transcription factor [Amycolatopsis mediterranei]|uniref:response regulator transcription factor n=1 Tax=Amycolatopsis mediterranei TaxID=33910 RepID=UPI0034131F13